VRALRLCPNPGECAKTRSKAPHSSFSTSKETWNSNKADLPSLVAAANNVARKQKLRSANLSPSQLNWKPSAERWSVAQCFDHLLTSNKGYFPVIDDVLAGKKADVWQSMPLLPGLAGKLLNQVARSGITRKIKAPKRFQPAQSDINASVINDFIEQQAKIVGKDESH
jgi:hypothetical protein